MIYPFNTKEMILDTPLYPSHKAMTMHFENPWYLQVYLIIQSKSNKHGYTSCSIKSIGAMIGLSKEDVEECLYQLTNKGLLFSWSREDDEVGIQTIYMTDTAWKLYSFKFQLWRFPEFTPNIEVLWWADRNQYIGEKYDMLNGSNFFRQKP